MVLYLNPAPKSVVSPCNFGLLFLIHIIGNTKSHFPEDYLKVQNVAYEDVFCTWVLAGNNAKAPEAR